VDSSPKDDEAEAVPKDTRNCYWQKMRLLARKFAKDWVVEGVSHAFVVGPNCLCS